MKDLVKYKNDLNSVRLGEFSEKEQDLFFSLIYNSQNKEDKEIQLDFLELKKLIGVEHEDRFLKNLIGVSHKLKKLTQQIILPDERIVIFSLFDRFVIDPIEKKLTIKVSQDFKFMLNELKKQKEFTIFELKNLISLNSSYSKVLFRLLSQFSSTGWYKIGFLEFKDLLKIPVSYRSSEINKRVLNPALSELAAFFPDLCLEKIKTGKSITQLNFTWKKEKKIFTQEIIDITISQELQDAFDKALKNRFVKEFLTEENKQKIINLFEEKDLIKGLKYAKENISSSFKTFSYLENSIKKGLEKPTIKTTIVPTITPVEEKNIILGEQLSIKTKVTLKEYEECYQEFLKTNNKKNGKQIRASWEISVKNKFEIIEESEEEKIQETKKYKPGITEEKYELLYQNFLILNDCVDSENTRASFDLLNKSKYQFVKRNITIPILGTDLENLSWEDAKGKTFVVCKDEEEFKKKHIVIREGIFAKKIIPISDIPEEKLLSKAGKRLVGGALLARLEKISRDEKIEIDYNGKKILVYK